MLINEFEMGECIMISLPNYCNIFYIYVLKVIIFIINEKYILLLLFKNIV